MIAAVAGFDWNGGNRDKCQKHGVSPAQIEGRFQGPIAVFPDPIHSDSEERFEFQPKSERINMRLPRPLLDAVKATAAKAGMPYQRLIRQALENAVQSRKSP